MITTKKESEDTTMKALLIIIEVCESRAQLVDILRYIAVSEMSTEDYLTAYKAIVARMQVLDRVNA